MDPASRAAALAVRALTPLLLILILIEFPGCTTTDGHFSGSAMNLWSDGEHTPPDTTVKVSVACWGTAPNGECYIAFRWGGEKSWLVLFRQPVEGPEALREKSLRATTASGAAAAWLVRGKTPDWKTLAHTGREAAFLTSRGERLEGVIDGTWYADGSFYVDVNLVGESGRTAIKGLFGGLPLDWTVPTSSMDPRWLFHPGWLSPSGYHR